MESLFIRFFNVGVSAAWLVLAVFAARLILRRAPKWTRVLMWALVGLRLALPFSIESAVSLVPSAETVPGDIAVAAAPQIRSGFAALNRTVNPYIQTSLAPSPEASVNPMQIVVSVAAVVWVCGAAAMLIYALASYARLRYRVREAVFEGDRVWTCDRAPTPFILGLFRPRIILPSGLSDDERTMILAHERAHLRRFDHIWKPLGFLLLAVNWYNPAIWLAYVLLCRDVELACDERVIRELGADAKAEYSRTLIENSIRRRTVAACPLAFGEVGIKARVKNVLHYKKPALWIIIAAIVLCAALAVCFLTDPKKDDGKTLAQTQTEDDAQSDDTRSADLRPAVEVWYCEQVNLVSSFLDDRANLILYYDDASFALDLGKLASLQIKGEKIRGGFEEEDGVLTLTADSGDTFVFRRDGDALVFDESASTGETYGAFGDNAAFLNGSYEGFSAIAYYDSASYDIDGDGENEALSIGIGPTSGLFSFTVTVTDSDGEKKYRDYFVTDVLSEIHFIYSDPDPTNDPTLCIFGQTPDGGERVFEVGIADGHIVLTENDVAISGTSDDAYYDSTLFDIDGDGEAENLSVGPGVAVGKFSFTVRAVDAEGNEKYRAVCIGEVMSDFWFGYMNDVFPMRDSLGPYGVFGRTKGGSVRFFEIGVEDGKMIVNAVGLYFHSTEYDVDGDGTEEVLRVYIENFSDDFVFTVKAFDPDGNEKYSADQTSEAFVSMWFGRYQPISPELSELGPFGVFGNTADGETRFYEIGITDGKMALNELETEDISSDDQIFDGAEPIATIRYRLEGACVLPHEYNSGVVAVYPGSAGDDRSFCVAITDADITTGEPVSPSRNIIFLDEFACKYDSLVFLYPDGSYPLTSSTGLPAGYPILRLTAKGVVHDFKIEIKQGHIVLSENGLKIPYYVPESEIGKEITISDDAEVWIRSSDAPDGDPSAALGVPRILLDREHGTYQITLNYISSYVGIGNFKETDDALILGDLTGYMTFVFKKVGNTLVYDEPSSDAYTYGAFANGAIFRKVSP